MAAFIYTTQPQLRYTMAAPGGKFMVALENPEDGFGNTSYDDQSYPDLTARYQLRNRYGIYSVSGFCGTWNTTIPMVRMMRNLAAQCQ